ncbi:N-acetyl-gamma-glutamyl-phosphate reductase [Paroceanicella profunda]|uniref:N-acetyl-gamma-glutamyl-phosphate reductase n=1 Tax=Paroceanicella profunda TaxID=2579971 RepID=A0A5B8FYQ3_9RHOB|nr:N-acetyl-gamma-glutamyl-phosphate reductase [Paroceanicella profunda]QDL92510.1 N-acetyl-gamma-glutamyl-phosphate reductase [Paroceanicella profunda]
MAWNVFIDGEAGTTGLQIRERLEARADIALIQLADDARKDTAARLEAFAAADVAILCLPDAAVLDIVPRLAGTDTRLIDASTAHRVAPDWVFGFPELTAGARAAVAGAERVSNPGCYASGAIALLHPLVSRGLVAADAPLSINAVSGYTGGGKAMVSEFEAPSHPHSFAYAMGQRHKHIPEIMQYGGLTRRPIFAPSVGDFAQGMVVQVPLHLGNGLTIARLTAAYAEHYDGARFVRVLPASAYEGRIDAERTTGTNRMEISVHGDDETGCAVLVAVLDNLGKGASGAAVQNLNLMLGIDEGTGLTA